MGRRSKVVLFEEIRREYEHGVGTIKGVAKKLGVHRRMVRRPYPMRFRAAKEGRREKPKIGLVQTFIDGILEADKRVHRKQRHTAHRIWCRVLKEIPGLGISESTVRKYVRKRKGETGLSGRRFSSSNPTTGE